MTNPLILLVSPLVAALLMLFLRRWPRVAGATAALAFVALAIFIGQINLDLGSQEEFSGLITVNSWTIFGRELVLTEAVRSILLFVYLALAGLSILVTIFPQGENYLPLSMFIIAPLTGALMVRPLLYGAVLVLIAGGLLAMFIQADRAGSTLSSVRYLSMVGLAVPLLLYAGWILETDQVPLMGTVGQLLAVAFLILFAGFPFQMWVAPLFSESRPLVPSLVLGVAQVMVVGFCLTLLVGEPSVQRSSQFWQLLRVSGVATLIVAGLFSLTAQTLRRLLGYLLLINVGFAIIAFSFLDRSGPTLTMTVLVVRMIGLVLSGLAVGIIYYRPNPVTGSGDLEKLTGSDARRSPMGLVLFVYGGLSLIGFPLTAGFRVNWMVLEQAASVSFWTAAVMVLATAAGAIAVIRFLLKSLRYQGDEGEEEPDTLGTSMAWAGGIAMAISVVFSIFLQPLVDMANRMVQFY